MIIVIDGPAASGKSTVAQLLAKELGFYYLYTGFLYRGLAYVLAHQYGYDDAQMEQVRVEDLDAIVHAQHNGHNGIRRFEYRYENGLPKIFFDGVDLSPFLKTKEIDNWASLISAQPLVRHAVFEYQVRIGNEHDVVAEGRDMGTVVFPQADYKFFLTAAVEVRAKRWQAMQKRFGVDYTLEESRAAVSERDQRDTGREHSPLQQAFDAVLIDCSEMTVDEVVKLLKTTVQGGKSLS